MATDCLKTSARSRLGLAAFGEPQVCTTCGNPLEFSRRWKRSIFLLHLSVLAIGVLLPIPALGDQVVAGPCASSLTAIFFLATCTCSASISRRGQPSQSRLFLPRTRRSCVRFDLFALGELPSRWAVNSTTKCNTQLMSCNGLR